MEDQLNIGARRSTSQKFIAKILIVSILALDVPAIPMAQAATPITDPSAWVSVLTKADPMMQGLNIPASAATQGMWSGVFNWPLNGLHTAVLPDGRVLSYGSTPDGNTQNGRYFDIWDASIGFGTNSHITTYRAQQVDSFCSTAAYLNDGTLLVTGGNSGDSTNYGKASTIFNWTNNSAINSSAMMADQRWYATMLTLPDNRKIILGGMQPYTEGMAGNPDQAIANGDPSMTPEIFESGSWRSLFGANSRDAFGPDFLRTSFPHAFVAPNGQVFGISADKMWYLDPNGNNGNGAITYTANFKVGYGNMADPVNVGELSAAVMYDVGKIIQVGGNGGFNGDGYPSSNMATMFDITNGTPVLTELPRMTYPRRLSNGTVLANGQVVITGGSKLGNNNGTNAVYAAEIWNPITSNWTVGANAAIYRGYHSTATLLANGAILSTGGGTPGPVTNLNAEIYYPPYLFQSANGVTQLASRPVIKAISGLSYNNNSPIQVDMATANTISGLSLIGLTTTTHGFNTGQRRIPLAFTQNSLRLTAVIPNANLTPPGYYQVVALDANGVPSYGTIIAIGQGQTPPPGSNNTYTPPDLSGTINAPIINAGATATYTVTAATNTTYSWDFGDGSAATAYNTTPNATHTFAAPGLYVVTLTAKDVNGIATTRTFEQAVATGKTAQSPTRSTSILIENRGTNSSRIWVVNPDNDSVSVLDSASNSLVAEINVGVGASPRNVAIAPDGRVWVSNKGTATISVISPSTLAVVQTITLPRASQPHGLAFTPNGSAAYVVLQATGQLVKFDPSTGAQLAITTLGSTPRHLSISADSTTILAPLFITPPLPGESTANVDTGTAGGQVLVINTSNMTVTKTITLQHSNAADTEISGNGVPNYLGAAVISPDGTQAWVPSKQDNIKRGLARNGLGLNFQNTVRAISSRISLTTLTEDYAKRVDHDNSSLGSAAVFHPSGVYMFVALETSREVAVVDAIKGAPLFKINVGIAPQGLTLSNDGNTLYVQNFMDRKVSVLDLTPLTTQGNLSTNTLAVISSITTEKLPANVFLGKQLFYDAKDTRLARDSYMSCASCHSEAGHDGRVWDFTGFGEGLRNTIALNGRAGMAHGFVHWSANFDEIQDFEGQIRNFAGGTGLMSDADFNTGTRSQQLGDKKAGISVDLDNLAAYVGSLNTFAPSPNRNADGTLTTAAIAGKTVFANSCASCHTGSSFTKSKDATTLTNIGTINALSGQRLGATLSGIDVPTLRDVWATAPYLHNGSAGTLPAAIQAHNNLALNATDLANVVAYTQQIGSEEVIGSQTGAWKFNEGTGNTVADGSGKNHPLTLTNTTWVAGVTGQATKFNGASASGATTAPTVDSSQSFAVSAWVKLDNLNGWQTFVNQDGINVSGFWLQYSQSVNNKFVLTMHDADSTTSNPYRAVSTTTPVVGQWYHVVGVRDKTAGTIKIYVNGKLEGTTAYTGGWTANGALNVGRGKWGGANDWMAGAIDEASTYDYALSDASIANLYNSSKHNLAPTVSMTAPPNNATYTQGASISLTANAADSDGTVTQVQFYDGATLLGTSTTAPYTYNWTTAAVGTHTITAKATDNTGAVTTSATVTVVVSAVTTSNLALTATLTTSYVSAWEKLSAVNDNFAPVNSADHTHGAYGNWNGTANYGKTNWVRFTWPTAKNLSSFEVYWWNDGQGIKTPTKAIVEYLDATGKWVSLGNIGLALNTYNKINFNVKTTSIRVSMSSASATGIIEAHAWGN